MMFRDSAILLLCSAQILLAGAMNLDYLDPIKLQTKTSVKVQARAATRIISKYSDRVTVLVDTALFSDHKDVFSLRGEDGYLTINASSGVAAVWGFNYYLKKYCNSHIGWQAQRVQLPDPLPDVHEEVVANDRFRYYQHPLAASYSYVWWDVEQWTRHVEWMALNGINLSPAPVAQEAAWQRVYRRAGMTQDEIDDHFTGPAFLAWHRMGFLQGWGGPLFDSWHARQRNIQKVIVDLMFQLGIIPVFPAFNGHVPKAFERIFPDSSFHSVSSLNGLDDTDYCCSLFVDPRDRLFKEVAARFLNEIKVDSDISHIYHAEYFIHMNTINVTSELATEIATVILPNSLHNDKEAVLLIPNTVMKTWSHEKVKAVLSSVPIGRILVLDMQSEQQPLYDEYDMYFGYPFIWNMLGNHGGSSGMFGAAPIINRRVYEVRSRANSTMIGVGITPVEINHNYVMYELMLESAWRKEPVRDLEVWAGAYAERRYGCNHTADAWKHLIRSVYGYTGSKSLPGPNIIMQRPTLNPPTKPWAWYKSSDLFTAFRHFVFALDRGCDSPGFHHDLVDVTRQALEYRAQQVYLKIIDNLRANNWLIKAWMYLFQDILSNIEELLEINTDFSIENWLVQAKNIASDSEEAYQYELNARSQIYAQLPFSSEHSEYASEQQGKPCAEVYKHLYMPRWKKFFYVAIDAINSKKHLYEENTQILISNTVDREFQNTDIIDVKPTYDDEDAAEITANNRALPSRMYKTWSFMPTLKDLPFIADS